MQTLSMLDRFVSENTSNANQTLQKIDLYLDNYNSRMINAWQNYQQALADLQYAQSNDDDDVPYQYYAAVNTAEAEYNRLIGCCNRIKNIRTSFCEQNETLRRSIDQDVETYSSILKKGSTFIGNYSEVLNQSNSILNNGGVGGGSSSYSSASGVSGNSQNIQAIGNIKELSETQQTWTTNGDGTTTFNAPIETGQMLDSNQGKVAGFNGTCGLVSCVNVLRMAGVNATEQQIVNLAINNNLCNSGSIYPDNNGGTTPQDRQAVLAQCGVNSELRPGNVENIAAAISEGRGVIAAFDAGRLWDDPDYYGGGHAVTITSVTKDKKGKILGFFVCDSGTGGKDMATFYSAEHIRRSLKPGREINVTSIIR